MAPDDNSFEGISAKIEYLKQLAEAFLKAGPPKTQDEADEIADVEDQLLQWQKKADAARVAEKKPFFDGGKAVDDKWRSTIGDAGIYSRLKDLCAPFLKWKKAQKEKREAEARRVAAEAEEKAREAAAAAAAALREQEAAAAAGTGSVFSEVAADKAAAAAEATARAAAEAKQAADDIAAEKITAGQRGKSIYLRSETTWEYEDRAAALAECSSDHTIEEALVKVINRRVKAGVAVAGVRVSKGDKAA